MIRSMINQLVFYSVTRTNLLLTNVKVVYFITESCPAAASTDWGHRLRAVRVTHGVGGLKQDAIQLLHDVGKAVALLGYVLPALEHHLVPVDVKQRAPQLILSQIIAMLIVFTQ